MCEHLYGVKGAEFSSAGRKLIMLARLVELNAVKGVER